MGSSTIGPGGNRGWRHRPVAAPPPPEQPSSSIKRSGMFAALRRGAGGPQGESEEAHVTLFKMYGLVWVVVGWGAALGSIIWAYYAQSVPLKALLLTVPAAMGLFVLAMRQYHRYRSGLQALIEGSLAKQKKADEEAKAAKSKAAAESEVSKAIDDLTKAVKGQTDDVTKAIQQQIGGLSSSVNAQGEMVKNMNDRLLSASTTLQGLTTTVASLDHRLSEIEDKVHTAPTKMGGEFREFTFEKDDEPEATIGGEEEKK